MAHAPRINRDHARAKLVVTFGVVGSSTLAVAAPSMSFHAVLIGIFANLVWIWLI